MEANKIYDDIVVALFNIIRNEKLRTKIATEEEYKQKTIVLIDNLLALEHDHECTFKDQKWSQVYAKSIVNITKQKIKFEKPDLKSLTDIYADYAEILTYSLNIFEIKKETLMNNGLEITAEEIKLNSKITDKMKETYSNAPKVDQDSEIVPVEIVNQNRERPNSNNNFDGKGFNHGDIEIPLPPLQNPRFYPYRTKPKYMKHIKMITGILFILFTVIYCIFDSFLVAQTISIPTSNSYFDNWEFLRNDNGELSQQLTLSIIQIYTLMGLGNNSIFFIIIIFISGTYIAYTCLTKPRFYREQYRFPMGMWFSAFILLIVAGFKFVSSGAIWSAITSTAGFQNNLETLFRGAVENRELTWTPQFSTDIDTIFNNYISGEINLVMINVFLWIEFIVCLLIAIAIATIAILNPRLHREKIMRANSEYQKAIGELMQGRKYEMDSSLFESKEEVENFYEEVRNRRNKRQN